MLFVRVLIGLIVVSALLFTAADGGCAEQNLDQHIAERAQQYQESLRQRAAQLSPSLQTKIESHAQQTVAKGLEKWKQGEINIQIALPRWAESQRIARFVARHLPFSGSPAGSFAFGIGTLDAAVIAVPVQLVLKPLTLLVADSIEMRSSVNLFQQIGNARSYYLQIVGVIVQRQ